MTNRLLWLGGALLLAGALHAEPVRLETLQVGSRTYHDVTVLGASVTDLYFTHAQGIANVKLKYLQPDLQKRFGYDPVAAAAVEQQRLEEEARFARSVAEMAAAEAERRSPAAQAARAWAELGLSDALGEGSLLHKPGPELTVEKWLGEKPDTRGKVTLVLFWASWSPACRAVLPRLNAWHKRYADKLVLIGVALEREAQLAQMPEPGPDFFSAIDSEAKLAGRLGVRTLPYCLLMDTTGVVRYEGHPAALDAAKLDAVLARSTEP